MRCPKCKSEDHAVYDSRPVSDSVLRRRKCKACGERWTTFEMMKSKATEVAIFLSKLQAEHRP